MHVPIWEHFEKQADQSGLDADKAATLLGWMMANARYQRNEEALNFVNATSKFIERYEPALRSMQTR